MRGSWHCLVPALVLFVAGCSSSPTPAPAPPPPRTTSLSLTEQLTKSRADLAAQGAELLEKIRIQQKAQRDGTLRLALLRELRLPLVPPVLRDAKFSAQTGCLLPPYVTEGTKDADLALHYARFGDLEAARKLVDAADGETVRRVEAARLDKNYPVEWTRLVGLLLHAAEMGVARGEQDCGVDLIGWHQELNQILDAKAKQSPLGTVLLAQGREVLTRAIPAWRQENQAALADRGQQALDAWGPVPPLASLTLGMSRNEVRRTIQAGAESTPKVLVAGNAIRALDLLAWPLPAETVETVLAFLDDQGHVSELQVVLKIKASDPYPRSTDLGLRLEEQFGGQEQTTDMPGMRCSSWSADARKADVTLIAASSAVGGFARWVQGPPVSPPTLPRSVQVAALDRTFEQNRLQINPSQRGDTISSDKAAVLKGVEQPLGVLKPSRVTVQRDSGQEVSARMTVSYVTDFVPLSQVVLPLWKTWGPARIEGVNDEQGGHLALVWQDGRTRCLVQFPYSVTEPVLFVTEDSQSSKDPSRTTQAQSQDKAERQARLKAGQPLTRLPRQLEWDQVKLGSTKDEVQKAVPSDGRTVFRRDVDDLTVFTFGNEPQKTTALMLRQLLVRFDKAGRMVEMRARYESGPAGKGFKELVAGLQKKGGAGAESPAAWSALWKGLPDRKPGAQFLTWKDDLTVMTCQTDAAGAEVSLRDWPADQDSPPSASVAAVLTRGPEGCVPGDKRSELLSRWKVTKPEMAGDALVLRPAMGGPYEVLLVYFEGDTVNRVVARHSLPAKQAPTQPAQMVKALQDAWGRELAVLGWPRRQDFNDKNVLTGMGWHDDRTQIWLFWQDSSQGSPRVYTEWKALAQ